MQWYHKSCTTIIKQVTVCHKGNDDGTMSHTRWVAIANTMKPQVMQGNCRVCLHKSLKQLWPWHCIWLCEDQLTRCNCKVWCQMQEQLWENAGHCSNNNSHCKKNINCDVTFPLNSSSTKTWYATYSWLSDIENKVDLPFTFIPLVGKNDAVGPCTKQIVFVVFNSDVSSFIQTDGNL